MPVTTLTVPTFIQPVLVEQKTEYRVRPLFFGFPVVTHRRYAEALSRYKEELKRRFTSYHFSRKTAEQLLWFKFSPEVKLAHFQLDFTVANRHVKGNFAVATFELQDNLFACLPNVGDFMFLVPKQKKGKADLRETTEKVIKQLFKRFLESDGDEFEPEDYFSSKKAFLAVVSHDVNFKEGNFSFEQNSMLDFFARFNQEAEFDGSEELEKVGHELTEHFPYNLRRAYFREELVTQVYNLVYRPENTPIVLVGREGSGKHTVLHEVAYRYMAEDEKRQDDWRRSLFWHINPNRIIAGMSIVGHWEKRFEAILKAVQQPYGRTDFPDKILIDNAIALLRIGKSAGSELTLANVLKPYLEKRQVQLVLLATPEEWKIVQEIDRGFSDLFQVLRTEEPDFPTAIKMVLENRKALEIRHDCTISIPAISQLFTIHRNFLKNKALPGGVMRLLAQLASKYQGRKVDAQEVREEFRAFSGLRERIFDESTKLEKDDVQQMLELDLVGQPEAVRVLANAIHLVKAKLTDRTSPMGSFLFIGPTGVGKTHAAKLLCRSLLGSEDYLLRFDMNEYIDAGALHRLIGDPLNPEGQLTGKVRHRPFSVILLDEIEKADPSIHDLLLQVLDDARLTDSLGRTVDFSNTIIIMTSNLGAREAAVKLGFDTGKQDNAPLYRKAVDNFFRPEFINRIETITIFNPLTFSEIQKIAQLQIKELLQREGFQRRTTIVNVAQDALDWVAHRGFDEKMGGRALKRQIERDLTLLSAEQLIRTTTDTPVILDIFLENNHLVPRITPLEFALLTKEERLPEVPDEGEAGKFFYQLVKSVQRIEETIRKFDQKKHRGTFIEAANASPDWRYFHFKEAVAELSERLKIKHLRQKDRHHYVIPAIPLRIRRGYFVHRRSEATKGFRENLRDRFFQKEALDELRDAFRLFSPEFDSFQTDYLMCHFDVAFLEMMLQGFLKERPEQVTLHFETLVANSGADEIKWLLELYGKLLSKMEMVHQVDFDAQTIDMEGFNLSELFAGEDGIHLFYLAHRVPLPIRLTMKTKGRKPASPVPKVIRLYDGNETITDLRTGFTSAYNLTPDELKLFLFGGLGGEKN